uniref:Uncharacterized protein n=1 Tax=Romanomermis culicivorax TaxID=13658 RepID=A0A915L8R9_ROMCU
MTSFAIIFLCGLLFVSTIGSKIRVLEDINCFGKDLVEHGKVLKYDLKSFEECQKKCVAHRQ